MGYVEDLRALVGHRPLIFVGAVVVITDEKGRLLLQQRKHPHGVWGLSGGLMELGESTEDVARREVYEESGLTLGKLELINVYSGPEHFVVAENGDEFYVVTVAYHTDDVTGNLVVDEDESLQFRYFEPEQLPDKMIGSHRKVIKEYLQGGKKDG